MVFEGLGGDVARGDGSGGVDAIWYYRQVDIIYYGHKSLAETILGGAPVDQVMLEAARDQRCEAHCSVPIPATRTPVCRAPVCSAAPRQCSSDSS
ncbi:hypothetical protein E2C01_063200 [Portunus trituberculatus]|uniref:Uncharacterized protein n=1 Tax=Portunus trituberculatus TaxID=210409 RepID=A0A5B7HIB4_PORTR|nr:hypothetical protein [Portunus trituberculatus]